jgi:putative ABC transport system permease protein
MTSSEGRLRRLLRSRILGPSIDGQIDEELDVHTELVVRELMAEGFDEPAARREALLRLGDRRQVAEACHRQARGYERTLRRGVLWDELRQDLVYAVRQLRRARSFTLLAMLTLAVGLGATTALFSVVHGIVLRSFPFAHPERTVLLLEQFRDEGSEFSVGNYVDLCARDRNFEAIAAMNFLALNLAEGTEPERVVAATVNGDFFKVFGISPQLGRTFDGSETEPGHEAVAVLSYALWRSQFGGDRAVIGRVVHLSSQGYRIIGVMPPSFDPTGSHEKLWVPFVFTPAQRAQHDEHYLDVVGLLKKDSSLEATKAEMGVGMRELTRRFPNANTGRSAVRLQTISAWVLGDLPHRLYILLGAVGLVLLIACANVASLLLARGTTRQSEFALRAAIGAGSRRLVRQLLTESAVLGLAAGALGALIAEALLKIFVRLAPPDIPRLDEVGVDGAVLGFALVISLGASVLFGLVPALRSGRQGPHSLLRGGMSSVGRHYDLLRSGLVACEVALALTLLVGAGLLIRSSIHLQNLPLGFDAAGAEVSRIGLPESAYPQPRAVVAAFEQIVAGLQQQPGVRFAAAGSGTPLGRGATNNGLLPEGLPFAPENLIDSMLHVVTPSYFQTLRIPLVAGRTFTTADRSGGERVMVVSRTLARRAFGDRNPIGKRLACCEEDPAARMHTVIGVVGDVRTRGPAAEFAPEFYVPITQTPAEGWTWLQRTLTLVVRSDSRAMATAALRKAVHDVDPTLPVAVTSFGEGLDARLAEQRFHTALLLGLGVLGFLLATVGIYTVVAYFVHQRTREIGIRLTLGASRMRIVQHLTTQGAVPLIGGLLIGAAAALGTSHWLEGQLYGVTAKDPLTFVAVIAVLGLTGWLAILVPALRAMRIDPRRAIADI